MKFEVSEGDLRLVLHSAHQGLLGWMKEWGERKARVGSYEDHPLKGDLLRALDVEEASIRSQAEAWDRLVAVARVAQPKVDWPVARWKF